MAKSTYISVNITHSQRDIFLLLNENEIDIFCLEDLKELQGKSLKDSNEIIENLVHKKIFSRIERGKYCRTNFRDEKVIGCFLVPDGVIGYWSALNLHGLTEQFSNTIFIQTTHLKKSKTVFGVHYQFVKIKETKRVGVATEGFGNYKYKITDKEKTLVDCFDLPQYSGGYAELIRAFSKAEIDQDKMIEYCKCIGNIAVVKRLAFLAELLKKPKMNRFLKYAKGEVNARYVLIDPLGKEEGSFNNSWKLRLNITEDELLDICNKQY
jgi:predicted transcriptional regulator of viral defense system